MKKGKTGALVGSVRGNAGPGPVQGLGAGVDSSPWGGVGRRRMEDGG